MSTKPIPTIEVFADIWCPFTHVGLRAIDEQRIRTGRTDVAIWVRAWPLELVNGAPLDPAVTKEHADDLREQVAPNLFRHLDVERFPRSTLDALALANHAYRTDLNVGEQVSFAFRDALFEKGCDISDRATLEHLAGKLGVDMPDESDHADVVADWHEGGRAWRSRLAALLLRWHRRVLSFARHHKGPRAWGVDRPGRLAPDGVPATVPGRGRNHPSIHLAA